MDPFVFVRKLFDIAERLIKGGASPDEAIARIESSLAAQERAKDAWQDELEKKFG